MQPVAPPRIPANELRPGRHWYVTAAAIAVVLTVLGVVIGVYRFTGLTDAVDTDRRFANGDTVTLRLGPGSEKTIWVKYPGRSPGPECDITGPGGPGLTDPGPDVFLTRDETWMPLHTIDVPRAGDYEVTCSSRALSEYAVGDSGGIVAFAGWLILAIALPVLGIGVCAAIVLVVAVRRRGCRKRLLAAAGRLPGPPDPAVGPQQVKRRSALS
ncbi:MULTISPECIES: hypothetical protein [Streptomyces]|uniref:Serine/arginine repetitive matrix protein 2 n=1 Tax=Streptomyces lycii TaxID=2654337 RepID=A0ABQ7FCE8_9ACTN|nr:MULTISPECIES: hypothetical protein [Streptomyces]KAF4405950.1 hypothetical protein GCU69_27530 [Streptomyces lycii]PGH48405.1 hypothetical protein CRI70_23345 [Streptomyces sp. Ru87]